MTSDGDKEYYYDVLGRLTLAESGLNSNVKLAAYRYDALGRLAMQVTYDYTHDPNDPSDPNDDDLYAVSNVTKYYYYDTPAGGDGASSPVLPQVVEIKDGSGDTTDQFVWGPAYVDELLLHERDADGDPNNILEQRLYAAHDTLYSVLRLVDEDGDVVEQYSYSPYGADPTDPRKGAARITDGDENELTPDDSVAEYLYTGRQFDKAVGLNYHRARRLSHNLGRWTRRDPAGVALNLDVTDSGEHLFELMRTGIRIQLPRERQGASAWANRPVPRLQYDDGSNLYAYAGLGPTRFIDSTGLRKCTRCDRCCTQWTKGWKLLGYQSKKRCFADLTKKLWPGMEDAGAQNFGTVCIGIAGGPPGWCASVCSAGMQMLLPPYWAYNLCNDDFCTADRAADEVCSWWRWSGRHCTCLKGNGEEDPLGGVGTRRRPPDED